MSRASKWLGVELQLEMYEQCVRKHDGVLRPSHPAVLIMVGSHTHTCAFHTFPDTSSKLKQITFLLHRQSN